MSGINKLELGTPRVGQNSESPRARDVPASTDLADEGTERRKCRSKQYDSHGQQDSECPRARAVTASTGLDDKGTECRGK